MDMISYMDQVVVSNVIYLIQFCLNSMRKHSRSLVICILARVWMKQFHSLKVLHFGLLVRFKGAGIQSNPINYCILCSTDMSRFFARRLQPHSISSGQVIHYHPFLSWVSLFHASFDKSLSKDFLSQLPGKSWEYCDASLLAFFQAVPPETRHQAVGIISLNKTNAVDGVENGSDISGSLLESEIWNPLEVLCLNIWCNATRTKEAMVFTW